MKLDAYTRNEVLGEKIHFHFTPTSGLHKEEEFRGLCVCVSRLVLVIPNKLDYSNYNRYECNLILFHSDAILRT